MNGIGLMRVDVNHLSVMIFAGALYNGRLFHREAQCMLATTFLHSVHDIPQCRVPCSCISLLPVAASILPEIVIQETLLGMNMSEILVSCHILGGALAQIGESY